MAHKTHTKRTRSRRAPRPPKVIRTPVPRPRLTPENFKNLAAAMRSAYRWDTDPKDFQLEAVKAQIEGADMIVQAPTGSGKTALAAGPHLWPGYENRFTLMVCPLLALEEEMEKTFVVEFGLKAIALNSKNGACSPVTLQVHHALGDLVVWPEGRCKYTYADRQKILALEYQVIIVSPEMLQSRTFINRVLRNALFMHNIISMFIDEAHCIAHWGADFHKKYSSIGKMRAFFPCGTPVIAVTATLTARVRRTIYASLHFAQSDAPSRFINKGNDRSNVSIVVRACEYPLNTYADLDFIIPTMLRRPSDIPKTYLYVDNIAVGGDIVDHLNERARLAACLEPEADDPDRVALNGLIRPFNATLSQEYRTVAMERFRAGGIRVLVCTDAAGMGCNIPDIDVVVQWKLPATFSNFIQRAGRAARGRNRTGLAVLLVEKSVYNVDLVSQPAPTAGSKDIKKRKATHSIPGSKSDPKATREYARAHGVLRGGTKRLDDPPEGQHPHLNPDAADEGLVTLVQSTICRRKVWAEVFESPQGDPTVPCCDICDPALLDRTCTRSRPNENWTKYPKRGVLNVEAQQQLRGWRHRIYMRDYAGAQYDESAILDDDLISIIASCGALSPAQIADALQDKWTFWSEYGAELTTFIQSLNIDFTPAPTKRRGKRNISAIVIPTQETAKRPRRVTMPKERASTSSSQPTDSGAPVTPRRPTDPCSSASASHASSRSHTPPSVLLPPQQCHSSTYVPQVQSNLVPLPDPCHSAYIPPPIQPLYLSGSHGSYLSPAIQTAGLIQSPYSGGAQRSSRPSMYRIPTPAAPQPTSSLWQPAGGAHLGYPVYQPPPPLQQPPPSWQQYNIEAVDRNTTNGYVRQVLPDLSPYTLPAVISHHLPALQSSVTTSSVPPAPPHYYGQHSTHPTSHPVHFSSHLPPVPPPLPPYSRQFMPY